MKKLSLIFFLVAFSPLFAQDAKPNQQEVIVKIQQQQPVENRSVAEKANEWVEFGKNVGTAMSILRDGSNGIEGRKVSLNRFIDTFLKNHCSCFNQEEAYMDIVYPFLREAKAFAGIYWANRGHYDDAMKVKTT